MKGNKNVIKLFLKTLFKILGIALAVFVVVGGIGIAWNYIAPNNSFSGVIDDIEDDRINVLLLATDSGELLTDTIMLASVNTTAKKINILSFPRDTLVKYKGSTVMINSLYGRGKEGERHMEVVNMVKEMTGLPVNYYVVIHPDGFRNVVDALGGVYIDVPQDMNHDDNTPGRELHIHLKKGYQLLDGDKAEQYTRFRGYPTADLGRIEAQQNFMREMFKQKVNAGIVWKARGLYKAIAKNVDTNFSISSVPQMAKIITSFSENSVHTYTLPGHGQNNRIVWEKDKTKKLIDDVFLSNEEDVESGSSDE